MHWYKGESLLHFLETVDTGNPDKSQLARMPVQWIIRPQIDNLHDYRGYSGRIVSGTFKVNDRITVLPSGSSATIDKIEFFDRNLSEAIAGQSVTLHLKEAIDISRGDTFVNSAAPANESKQVEANICWMDTRDLDLSLTYLIQHNSKITRCKIAEVIYRVDINTLEKQPATTFKLNDIGKVVLKTAEALAFDPYQENRGNGAAILIDSRTNLTVAAVLFS
jgi:sulfate adenylyltransferase subunit 1